MAEKTPRLLVRDVFGNAGEVYRPIVKRIVTEAVEARYTFMPIDEFKALPCGRMSQVYWEEMLYRVHLAATSNLQRHQRWFESCLVQSVEHPNYLGFCASLRGLTEGAADAKHSFQCVPMTLADHYRDIWIALLGHATSMMISGELENALIHFQYARRIRPNEQAPDTHRAQTAANYISAIDTPTDPARQMYAELCDVTHPAMSSLSWTMETDGIHDSLSGGDDAGAIRDLCRRYLSAIEWLQMASVNLSIMMLMVLNAFPLTGLHTDAVRRIDMTAIQGWTKIESALLRQGARKTVLAVQ